jgi:hypothetical protein
MHRIAIKINIKIIKIRLKHNPTYHIIFNVN